MRTSNLSTRFLFCFTLIVFLIAPFMAFAQSSNVTVIPINCGAVVQGELTASEPTILYSLDASAGTKLRGELEPLGTTFNPEVIFFDSANNTILQLNTQPAGGIEDLTGVDLSISNPTIGIFGVGPDDILTNQGGTDNLRDTLSIGSQTFGAYTLTIGCQLRDGTIIDPGSTPTPQQNGSTSSQPPATAAPSFSGNGFPGLAPVDFSKAIFLPFNFSSPNSGGITPGFDAVFGFTLDAKANDVFALDFKRLSGNLNLGLAVLSSDNKIVFQASLVTSSDLSTDFTLPSAGQYTIGVYRIDLLPPDSPQSTTFQITGTLSSG